ncbi:RING/U-box superfamily protein [Theobroma cacao]|uniref:E3 ubiquitin-protein ligase RMA n=1 Tax=Theobroma cacao TaxID=3641 RepID=A0A061FCE8_THECC|nr:RING/U-box superfamily protein [Theobroma cacao]
MAGGFGESASRSPQSPSCSSNNANGDAGNFECNICFDLAQDPIVTLCGHLFCWPCLYKWLNIHSRSHECPVCKALIEEEKLVPLYGRGKSSSDPRSKSIPGVNIPNRPAGQRPETAPPPEPNQFPQNGLGFMGGLGGFAPMATARFGNFTLSAAFGGLIPSLFNLQVHGFPDAAMFGAAAGQPSHDFAVRHRHTWVACPAWSVGTADRADLKALVSCQIRHVLAISSILQKMLISLKVHMARKGPVMLCVTSCPWRQAGLVWVWFSLFSCINDHITFFYIRVSGSVT